MFRKNIFDSESEKRVYQYLDSRWNDCVRVAHHIPVTNIFPYELLKKTPNITSRELDFLLKTSFDFVITTNEEDDYGTPLFIIEFDGIGKGYRSKEGYILKSNAIAYRKLKMDCKIKVCQLMEMPIIVVSYQEVKKEKDFTILDGIIGEVLSSYSFVKELREQLESSQEELLNMHPIERQSAFDWIVCNAEVDSEMKYNPIVKRIYEMEAELSLNKIKLNRVWRSGTHEERNGYQIYEGWATLDKKFNYLLNSGMKILDNSEKPNESDSKFDRDAKIFMSTSEKENSFLIRKEIKMRSLYCEDLFFPKIAEDLAHYLIISEVYDKAKHMGLIKLTLDNYNKK